MTPLTTDQSPQAPTFDSYRGELQGIGVAVPAACDPATGRVVACTPVPGLVDTRLAALVAERTGHGVLVEQDAALSPSGSGGSARPAASPTSPPCRSARASAPGSCSAAA